MSVGGIEAGRAFVRLLVNDKELQQGLTRAQNKLKLFAASTGQLGRQLMGLSAAIAAPGVAGAKAFLDFERQMAEVSTMLANPAEFMGQFTEGIKTLAIEFGESTDTLAKGLYDILSASIPPAQAMDVLTASVRAAKAGLSDTATAADAITTILNAYQMRAEEAASVSDWMFAVMKRGKTTFADLAPNIGKVATIAATAGVSLDELGAMLAVLTRNGISTEEAVTSLNAIVSTFLKPTDEAQQLAQQLGFTLSAATIQAEGLEGVFEEIASLPPEAIARLFPNVRALKGALPALRDLEGFAADLAAMQGAAGSTEEAYRRLADTLSEKFKQVKQAVVIAAAEIGEALRVDLAAGADQIKEIGKYVAEWINNHQTLIRVIGETAITIGAVGGALIVFQGAAKAAAIAVGGLKTALHGAGLAATFLAAHPVVAVLAGIAIALGVAAAASGAFGGVANELAGAMANVREKADEMRTADLALWQELQQLAIKGSLTNDEFERASQIIDTLQGRYGDLGLSIDRTAGVMGDLQTAQQKLNAAMKRATIAQLAAEIANYERELAMLEKRRASAGHEIKVGLGLASDDDLVAEIDVKRKQVDAAKMRVRALEGLDADQEALTGAPRPTGPHDRRTAADPILDEIMAKEKAADYQAKLDERAHQARLAMIADEETRALEAIRAKHDAEMEEARQAGRDTEALGRVQAAERLAIVSQHDRRREEERKRTDEQRAERQTTLQEQIEEMEIKVQYEGLDQSLKLIELERQRRLEAAPISGESVADINRFFDLQEELAKRAGLAGLEQRTSVAGTFSAQMAARMGGTIEDRQLRTLEEIARTGRETKEEIRKINRAT